MVIRYVIAMCILLGSLMCGTGCRNEPSAAKEKIKSIEFDKERAVIGINEETTVRVIVKTDEAKKNEKIAYTSINEGVIAIREPTNDGFIIKGLKGGTTVVTAKSELVTSYFEVVVEGDSLTAKYITVANPVIEIMEGDRRSTQVNLYKGSVNDNYGFKWRLENGKDNIGIDVTANIAVISGFKRGHQKIIVSHADVDFESEILVFVTGVEEKVRYISAAANVILVANNGQYQSFEVALVNGELKDNIDFKYEIIEGKTNIDIVQNANVFNVRGLRGGSSLVRIKHPLAVYADFDVRIITYDVDIPYIDVENTFVLLNVGESKNIRAEVIYARNGMQSNSEFSYKIMEGDRIVSNENSIIEVIKTSNYFYVRARRGGAARIIIDNEQADTRREILIVVRNEAAYRDDYYITTTQNVIMLQVGDSPVQLNMQLVNGVPADSNGFEWVVDDGTVILVESGHGLVRGNRATLEQVFNAIAVITAKKAGTAKITITHGKSEVAASVLVKVFPKGTFAESPVLVGYEGLIKVKTDVAFDHPDRSPKGITLEMVQGDILDVGSLNWSTADRNIAQIDETLHGMVNTLSATGNGLTRLLITDGNLSMPHESLVLAGTAAYVDAASVIYMDSIYQILAEQQTVRKEIKNSHDAAYWNQPGLEVSENTFLNSFRAKVTDTNILYAVMIKNELIMMGKEVGETKVVITNEYALNDITVNVRVDPSYINIDKPFHLTGPDIKGVVRGRMYDGVAAGDQPAKVTLVGSGESEKGRIIWSIDDPSVAEIYGSGSECWIRGLQANQQTRIRVNHPKSENEKVILLYVVGNDNDLDNKVVLGLEKENYLMVRGKEQLIALITNANDTQKLGLKWKIKGEADGVTANGIVSIEPHYDSAMVRAVGRGNAELIVTHADNILPLSIYISVIDETSAEKYIGAPAVIELIRNESRIISLNHNLTNPNEIGNIKWSLEDMNIANIQENGDQAYMLGLKKGVSFVNIRQESLGFRHRSTLVCANSHEELASMYVMGVDSSYHTMMAGEEKKIKLTFGSAGFPEAAKSAITWTPDLSGAVRVSGKGESVTIVAVNEGIGKVTVESEASFNSLEISFEVRGHKTGVYELRASEKIKGMLNGTSGIVTVGIWEKGGGEILGGYSLLEFENENDNIISIDPVGNLINITAKNSGQSYITVRHKQADEAAKILVYTASTPDGLANYYPILIEKSNYLLQIDESAVVKFETILSKDTEIDDNGRRKVDNVSWGPETDGIVSFQKAQGGKEASIRGLREGTVVISVSYKGEVKERVFVTVVSGDAVDMTKYIVTENIIGLPLGGGVYTARIFSNLGTEINSVVWESLNPAVVTVNGSGDTGLLTAVSKGEAYITVSYGPWLKRYILVYVTDNGSVNTYKAMNMENQYIRVGLNETFILPLFFAKNKPAQKTTWTDKYENKVISFEEKKAGAEIEIKTLNEGVAVLEADNSGLSRHEGVNNVLGNPGVLRVYVEVSKKYNNIQVVPELRFLSILKTIWVMNPNDINAPLDLSVTCHGSWTNEEISKIRWDIESGSQYVTIAPNGKDCKVMVNWQGYEGEAVLRAYYLDNVVQVKIIVSRNALMGYPHIVGEDVVRIGLGNKVLFEYNVAEILSYDRNLFVAEVLSGGGNYITARMTGSMLEVEGKATGQALIRISCKPAAEFTKEVIVIVTSTPSGLVYLTTTDSFSQIRVNESKVLKVEMAGYENSGDIGYDWRVEESHVGYIDLHYTGKQAQVRGLAAGAGKTAKIYVGNSLIDPQFNIVLYVRVSDADANSMYMKTANNIVSVVKGRSMYLSAEIVNGEPVENSFFNWTNLSGDIISLEGASNGQAVIVGNNVGIGRVKVTHLRTINREMEILVVVEKDMTEAGIYISTENTLIDIRPNDTKPVEVRLVGGNPEDVYGFAWDIAASESVVKVNGKNQAVINLVPNANRAYINGIRDGEATVRVTHPRTNYVLDMKVYVRQYSAIKFVQRSVSVEMGETAMIEVESPAGIAVVYSASKYTSPVNGSKIEVVRVSGTNSVCVIETVNEGICYIYATDALGSMTDQIVVQVTPSTKRNISYIQTSDVIFNMTDWQSSLNRAMIEASVIGEDERGFAFTSVDDNKIQWEVVGNAVDPQKDGTRYIGLHNETIGGQDKVYTGKTVTVFTKNQPTERNEPAKIRVTHPSIPKYEKILYVNVHRHDSNFTISPVFFDMQINDRKTVEAFVGNIVADDPYKLVTWEKKGDGINLIPDETGKTAQIIAVKDGVYKIEATYNNSYPPVEATVYIEKERHFEIVYDSFIPILPRQTKFVWLYVDPLQLDGNVNVRVQTDYLEWLEIAAVCGFDQVPNEYRDEFEIAAARENIGRVIKINEGLANEKDAQINAVMIIKGKEREGYTTIKLTSSNIERVVTVNTNYNFVFFMKGVEENGVLRQMDQVRGKPNQEVTVVYEIYPEFDNVVLKEDTNKITNMFGITTGKLIARNIDVFSNQQKVKMTLDTCGFTEMEFLSDYNRTAGINMIVPTYVYYDRINLTWTGTRRAVSTNHRGAFKSRVDSVSNAIYIADGEILNLDYIRDSSGYPAGGYYGADICYSHTEARGAVTLTVANTAYQGLITANYTDGFVSPILAYPAYANRSSVSGFDNLLSADYVGTLEIHYEYSTGGKERTVFDKTFMVYAEKWARKP